MISLFENQKAQTSVHSKLVRLASLGRVKEYTEKAFVYFFCQHKFFEKVKAEAPINQSHQPTDEHRAQLAGLRIKLTKVATKLAQLRTAKILGPNAEIAHVKQMTNQTV